MIVQRFNLNLIPNQSPVVVHVNQYDTGTGRLIATLYEGNEPYSPNGTAVIQGTKPDGHGFQYTATLDGNVVTADLTEQMAPVAGDVRTQIVVTESSGVTGTFVFIMRVQPSALPSDADMSESDYPLIEEAIREAQEAVIDSHDNAENSEAWAQGTRGGVPVGPTDPTYEHNAEYWAHQAETAASGVSTFNGRSGSILPMAGDYDSKKILLSSALHIGGETQSDVQQALEALSDDGVKSDGVKSFNGRSGSVLPMAGDYSAEQVNYDSNQTVKQKIDALVTKEESDIAGQQSLVKDTVGWTGKNLFNPKNIRNDSSVNCTITDNGKNIRVVSKTTGQYRNITWDVPVTPQTIYTLNTSITYISGVIAVKIASESGATIKEVLNVTTSRNVTFDFNSGGNNFVQFSLFVTWGTSSDGDATFIDTMLRKADITDPTYEPYHESVEVMYEEEIHGVNLLKFPYWGWAMTGRLTGITATNNGDGSITWNPGTCTDDGGYWLYPSTLKASDLGLEAGTYVLTCDGSDTEGLYFAIRNRTTYIDYIVTKGKPVQYIVIGSSNDNLHIYVWCNANVTLSTTKIFKPMIRKADIEDPTYRPYNPQAIQNQLNAQGVLGAKNLLPNLWTSKTAGGITFTANSDGSVTVNGTATADVESAVDFPVNHLSAGKTYILNGCPSGGSESKYTIDIFGNPWNAADFPLYRDKGDGVAFTVPSNMQADRFRVRVLIVNGQTVNNLVFKPMIRLASDPDDTYQPYAMTNRELTEKKINIADLKTVVSASSDFADFKTRIASL